MATKFHPTNDKKVRAVKVRLTESDLETLHRAAAARRMTLSAYIRGLIDDDVYAQNRPHFERKTAKKRIKNKARRATIRRYADEQAADEE